MQNKCNILQDEDQDHLKHEHIEVHVHDVNEACEHADDVSLHAKRTESAVTLGMCVFLQKYTHSLADSRFRPKHGHVKHVDGEFHFHDVD